MTSDEPAARNVKRKAEGDTEHRPAGKRLRKDQENDMDTSSTASTVRATILAVNNHR